MHRQRIVLSVVTHDAISALDVLQNALDEQVTGCRPSASPLVVRGHREQHVEITLVSLGVPNECVVIFRLQVYHLLLLLVKKEG